MIGPFTYRLQHRVLRPTHGSHSSEGLGAGKTLFGWDRWSAAADARHLDFRASARDPLGQLWVRRFHQLGDIGVYLVVDISASMGGRNSLRRRAVLDFAQSLVASCAQRGDPMGIVACGGRDDDSGWSVGGTRNRVSLARAIARLAGETWQARSAEGLSEVSAALPRRGALIFLLSDFYWPDALVREILSSLRRHYVVPVVVISTNDEQPPAKWGLCLLRDRESGTRKLVVLRPALAEQWRRAQEEQRTHIRKLLASHGLHPFLIVDSFKPAAMSAYFGAGV